MELSHVDSRVRVSRSHLVLGWSQALWIAFGSSRLGEGVLQEDFGLFEFVFRSCVKIDSVNMLKCTTHTSFMFWI